jgi:putative sigma-54 modulation protein
MRLELTGRHVQITPTLRRLVDSKLAKIERLLNDSAVSAQVVLSRERYRLCAEITLHARGEKFLHGIGRSADWETSLVQAIDKLAQQAHRVKGKWQERKRHGVRRVPAAAERREPKAAVPPTTERERLRMPRMFRTMRQAIRLMSVPEAVRAIDGQDDGLLVFRDPERLGISVLYRRQNGELTLVETES